MDPIKNSEFTGKNICNIFIKPNVVQNQKQVYFVDTSLIVIRIPDAINQKKKASTTKLSETLLLLEQSCRQDI